MARVTNEGLAIMITAVDKKVDGVNIRLDTLNSRSFKNSTDIAKMKGTSGAISACVSFGVSVAYFLWNIFKAKTR